MNYYDRDALPISPAEWERLIGEPGYKRVARSSITDAADPSRHFNVSTVWLGLDHSFGDGPPIIFETLVFSDDEEDGQRYATLTEAQDGHRAFVVTVAATLIDLIVTDLEGQA